MTESEPAAPGQIGASSLRDYQRTRKMPPPRHPKKIFPVPEPEPEITPEVPEEPVGELEPEPEPAKIVAAPAQKQGSARKKPAMAKPAPRVIQNPLKPMPVLLDVPSDIFLRGVIIAADMVGEKSRMSKSGIIRYALARLDTEFDSSYADVMQAILADDLGAMQQQGRPRG